MQPLPTAGATAAIYSAIEKKIPQMPLKGLYNLCSQKMPQKQPDTLKTAIFDKQTQEAASKLNKRMMWMQVHEHS